MFLKIIISERKGECKLRAERRLPDYLPGMFPSLIAPK